MDQAVALKADSENFPIDIAAYRFIHENQFDKYEFAYHLVDMVELGFGDVLSSAQKIGIVETMMTNSVK